MGRKPGKTSSLMKMEIRKKNITVWICSRIHQEMDFM